MVSEGWYLRDSYYCCLDIFITNKEGKCIQETLIINDDDWCLDDAVEEFNLNYLIAPIREFGE